jgi:uncharacterized protein YbjQ (UPF0145 family)
MKLKYFLTALFIIAQLSGCGTVSSSSAPTLPIANQVKGPIYVTTAILPSDIQYTVIGKVKANARAGYDDAENLYPLLADEARKIGANAVISVYKGHSVSAFSWAAPYTGGTAIQIDNIEELKRYKGQYY